VPEVPHDRSATADATVTNAAYWAARALELASALSSGLTVIGDPSGQPTDPEQLAVVVDPAWWAQQPGELADALGAAAGEGTTGDGRSPGAITSGGARLTLTVEEAAAVLGISRASAYEATHRGEIPCIRIGRRILVPRIALDRLLAAAGGESADGADGQAT
jgi:excisionase family DNA binding protein